MAELAEALLANPDVDPKLFVEELIEKHKTEQVTWKARVEKLLTVPNCRWSREQFSQIPLFAQKHVVGEFEKGTKLHTDYTALVAKSKEDKLNLDCCGATAIAAIFCAFVFFCLAVHYTNSYTLLLKTCKV